MNQRLRRHLLTLALLGLPLAAGRAQGEGFGFVLATQWQVSSGEVRALAFAPDGSWVAAAAGRECALFALDEAGRVERKGDLTAARKEILGLAVSPDGRTLALVDGGGTLSLYDSGSLAAVATVPKAHAGRAAAVAFTADGSYVLTGGQDGKVKAWTPEGRLFAELGRGGHDKEVVMLAGVPPGRNALSVGKDRRVLLWDVDTQRAVRPTGVDMDVLSAHLNGSGKVLALGLQTLVGNRSALAGTRVSAHEIKATDTVRLIDAETGTELRDLEGEEQDLDSVGVTPDGRFVAAAGSGRSAAVWDAATGKRVNSIPFDKPVTALAFAPSGKWLVTGTRDGALSLYRLTGVGPVVLPGPGGQIIIIIMEPQTVAGRGGGRTAPRVDTPSLKLRGRIKSPVPLAAVEVDGREITSLVEDESGDSIFTAYVPLPAPGQREVDVFVRNQAGATARESLLVERAAQVRAVDPGPGRRLALIVGISKYADRSVDLEYADDDARALYELLTSKALGPAAFRPQDVRLLLDEQATVANVTIGLREFLQQADENDFVLVFFAGHGVPDPNNLQNLYLMAHDTRADNVAGTGLLMRHFREAVAEIRARDVLILTDACHSAGVAAPKSIRNLPINTIHQVFLDKMRHSSGGLAILTASEAAQVSVEGERWGKHGVFTYFLLQGLRGAADEDRDKIVTLGEIMEYVRQKVREETGARQVPAIGPTSFDRQLPLLIAEP